MNRAAGAGAAMRRLNGSIPVGPGLHGDLAVPPDALGVALFAHGSGSSRFSPRNRRVADSLNRRGIATLLFDLLTPAEEPQRASVFDVELLGDRLVGTTRWLLEQPLAQGLPPCYFGASTGAAAALTAAAQLGSVVRAVVSRGGRPDLAGAQLPLVEAPTLLVVGGRDDVVLGLNRPGTRATHVRAPARRRPPCRPPLRRAGGARARCPAHRRLVRQSPGRANDRAKRSRSLQLEPLASSAR